MRPILAVNLMLYLVACLLLTWVHLAGVQVDWWLWLA